VQVTFNNLLQRFIPSTFFNFFSPSNLAKTHSNMEINFRSSTNCLKKQQSLDIFFGGCFAVELLSCDVTAVPSLNPGLPVPAMVSLAALKAFPKRYYMGNHNILMEEIRLTSGYGEFATIYSVLYIPGACLGFLPSTVFHNQR